MGTCRVCLRRLAPLALFAGVVLLAAGVPSAEHASAAGSPIHQVSGLANGVSGISIAYRGSTATPGDQLGEQIIFTVEPTAGSSADPEFTNGSRTITLQLGGAACDGAPDSATTPGAVAKCFARATVFSDTPGSVRFTTRNSSSPAHAASALVSTFFVPRFVLGNLRRGDTSIELNVQNAGIGMSLITVDYYDSSGQNLPNARSFFAGVTAGGTGGSFANRLPNDFDGVAIVGSDQPVVATSVLTRTNGSLTAAAVQNGALLRPSVTSINMALPYVANALESTYNTDFA